MKMMVVQLVPIWHFEEHNIFRDSFAVNYYWLFVVSKFKFSSALNVT